MNFTHTRYRNCNCFIDIVSGALYLNDDKKSMAGDWRWQDAIEQHFGGVGGWFDCVLKSSHKFSNVQRKNRIKFWKNFYRKKWCGKRRRICFVQAIIIMLPSVCCKPLPPRFPNRRMLFHWFWFFVLSSGSSNSAKCPGFSSSSSWVLSSNRAELLFHLSMHINWLNEWCVWINIQWWFNFWF